MKLDADEKELLDSVERGEWKSAKGGKRERARYARYAKATFRKDRRLNIRLSSKDLEAIQKRALADGLPYQTLIASLLHKYASGRLKEGCRETRDYLPVNSLPSKSWPTIQVGRTSTAMLLAWQQGDEKALEGLIPLVYTSCVGWLALACARSRAATYSRRRHSCMRRTSGLWISTA